MPLSADSCHLARRDIDTAPVTVPLLQCQPETQFVLPRLTCPACCRALPCIRMSYQFLTLCDDLGIPVPALLRGPLQCRDVFHMTRTLRRKCVVFFEVLPLASFQRCPARVVLVVVVAVGRSVRLPLPDRPVSASM